MIKTIKTYIAKERAYEQRKKAKALEVHKDTNWFTEKASGWELGLWAAGMVCITIFIISFITIMDNGSPPVNIEHRDKVAFIAEPVQTVYLGEFTFDQLIERFDANEVAFNAELAGKRVTIVGKVTEIGIDWLGSYYVSISDSHFFNTSCCYFPTTSYNTGYLSKLKKGNIVKITGTISSRSSIVDCSL